MNRKHFLQTLAAGSGLLAARPLPLLASDPARTSITKRIPSTGEDLPVIGMGTWLTFSVPPIPEMITERTKVLRAFFAGGGGMIDSSPMYGPAEQLVGDCLKEIGYPRSLFSATKIWTSSTAQGPQQFENSKRLWGLERIDLEQVHNLVNWRAHLKTLRELKENGQIRYIGVTTSHGRRHAELENILRSEPIDFVQLTYNIERREVEERLLPLAEDRGIAVIANRPFGGGSIIKSLKRSEELPAWAPEMGIQTWADFLLKFIVSHPAVTCAIPATSKVKHMTENMAAGKGRLPDPSERKQMSDYFDSL